jgi:diadenosine tetraphosphatase ApaH/serine/threonine PP2A family protein phosphatase
MERLNSLPRFSLLLGNHDAAAIWQMSPYQMNARATQAILWTMDQLSEAQTRRLAALESTLQAHDMLFCHANPYSPQGWRYVTTWFSAMRSFLAARHKVIFVGHTHRPRLITRSSGLRIRFNDPPPDRQTVALNPGCRYIVDCGSIGQPRDGNPEAGYVICDTEVPSVVFRRVAYDIEGAARRIRQAGLPRQLAERLFRGR